MNKIIIAVDIGLRGAVCIRTDNPAPDDIQIHPMPLVGKDVDYKKLHDLLVLYKNEKLIVIFEKLGVIFGTSKATAFSMGHQCGALKMLCIALNMPYYMVSAKVWQKDSFQGTNLVTKKSKSGKSVVTDTKATALIVVKQLFPDQKLTFGNRATKPHDGLIDSLLLSEFAKRRNL